MNPAHPAHDRCDARQAVAREQTIMLRLQARLGTATHIPLLQLKQLAEFADGLSFLK